MPNRETREGFQEEEESELKDGQGFESHLIRKRGHFNQELQTRGFNVYYLI